MLKQGELIGWVRAGVRPPTFSNVNISKTSWSNAIKFYPKHHGVGGNNALGFGPDRIRALVSMATYSFHRKML